MVIFNQRHSRVFGIQNEQLKRSEITLSEKHKFTIKFQFIVKKYGSQTGSNINQKKLS